VGKLIWSYPFKIVSSSVSVLYVTVQCRFFGAKCVAAIKFSLPY
jgi:hypothetical protein